MTSDVRAVLDAAQFAAQKHSAQRRKGDAAEPYINHLIEVANLVADAMPEGPLSDAQINVIIAALLHDTIEDTGTSKQELIGRFGQDVADLVEEVTDDKSLPKAERKRLQVVNAPKKTKRAQMIKIADKISNLRSIVASPPAHWTYERKKIYFEWAKDVVSRLKEPNPILMAEFERQHARFCEIENC